MLEAYSIGVRERPIRTQNRYQFTIRVNRPNRRIVIVSSHDPTFDLKLDEIPSIEQMYSPKSDAAAHKIIATKAASIASTEKHNSNIVDFLLGLMRIYEDREASTLRICISGSEDSPWLVDEADFHFDDAAFRSGKRQQDLQALRDLEHADPDEVEAEQHGIVYIKYVQLINIAQ